MLLPESAVSGKTLSVTVAENRAPVRRYKRGRQVVQVVLRKASRVNAIVSEGSVARSTKRGMADLKDQLKWCTEELTDVPDSPSLTDSEEDLGPETISMVVHKLSGTGASLNHVVHQLSGADLGPLVQEPARGDAGHDPTSPVVLEVTGADPGQDDVSVEVPGADLGQDAVSMVVHEVPAAQLDEMATAALAALRLAHARAPALAEEDMNVPPVPGDQFFPATPERYPSPRVDGPPPLLLPMLGTEGDLLEPASGLQPMLGTEGGVVEPPAGLHSMPGPEVEGMVWWYGVMPVFEVALPVQEDLGKLARTAEGHPRVLAMLEDAWEPVVAQLEGHLVKLSCHRWGTLVVQQALEVSTHEWHLQFAQEVSGCVSRMSSNLNGNHVIQKFLEVSSAVARATVVAELESNLMWLARHEFGCRVIQRLIEHESSESMQVWLAESAELVWDRYGHHVLEALADAGSKPARGCLETLILPQVSCIVATHHPGRAFAMRVLERLLRAGSPALAVAALGAVRGMDPRDLYATTTTDHGSALLRVLLDQAKEAGAGALWEAGAGLLGVLRALPAARRQKRLTASMKRMGDALAR